MIRILRPHNFHRCLAWPGIVLLSLCLLQHVTAQHLNFKQISPADGLAGSIVNTVFQDSRGYIWFGTQGKGISRYDYNNFRNYTSKDGLAGNDVTFITEDRQGNICIATTGGLSVFDGKKFTSYTSAEITGDNIIYWIHVNERNEKWLATSGNGVVIFHDGKLRKAFSDNELPDQQVFAMTSDPAGKYWMALGNGIACYDGEKITSFRQDPLAGSGTFFSIHSDRSGNIWFGSVDGIVLRFDGNTFSRLHLPEPFSTDFIGSILQDSKGKLWFATSHGALVFDTLRKEFTRYSESNGLLSDLLLTLSLDYEGNVLIGTQGRGAFIFRYEPFAAYKKEHGLADNHVTVVQKTDDGAYIAGTNGGGLHQLTDTGLITLKGPEQLNGASILSVDGGKYKYWAGSEHHGLLHFERAGNTLRLLRNYLLPDGENMTPVVKVLRDSAGNTWAGTYGSGIFRINPSGTIQHFSKANGFPSDNILCLAGEPSGQILAGTYDQGLIRILNDSTFVKPDSLNPSHTIWCIATGDSNALYYGTADGGIRVITADSTYSITTRDGLSADYIASLVWDDMSSSLWAGTDKGINKILLDKDSHPVRIRHYGTAEGFTGSEVNQNGIVTDQEQILFGTTNGLIVYSRHDESDSVVIPRVVITEVMLHNKTVDWNMFSDSLDPWSQLPSFVSFDHSENQLLFRFQAMTLHNWKYQYMVEGLDQEWSPPTGNGDAYYSSIPPGEHYTFKVRLISPQGLASSAASFSFRISPPWWNTWQFYTGSILVALLTIAVVFRMRTARLRNDKMILEQTVTERTAEIVAQKQIIEYKNREITDSINYAKRIQNSLLPTAQAVKSSFPESFILYLPKDIISGDFYWYRKTDTTVLIAAADCTGHGVPGALMSIIGSDKLTEASSGTTDVSAMLGYLNKGVKQVLRQDSSEEASRDGLDIALCSFDLKTGRLSYAGANRPLWIISAGSDSIREIKATKAAIGGHTPFEQQFKQHEVLLQKGDFLYIFSDGFADQFGTGNKKMMTRRLREQVLAMKGVAADEQLRRLKQFFYEWKGDTEQTDDVLVIGIGWDK